MRHKLTDKIKYGTLTLNRIQEFLDKAASLGAPGSSEFSWHSESYNSDYMLLNVYWEDKR